MERITVISSNISALGYDPETQILEVEFLNGSVYEYSGIPSSEYDGLMNSDSKGKYFNANIKTIYPVAKL